MYSTYSVHMDMDSNVCRASPRCSDTSGVDVFTRRIWENLHGDSSSGGGNLQPNIQLNRRMMDDSSNNPLTVEGQSQCSIDNDIDIQQQQQHSLSASSPSTSVVSHGTPVSIPTPPAAPIDAVNIEPNVSSSHCDAVVDNQDDDHGGNEMGDNDVVVLEMHEVEESMRNEQHSHNVQHINASTTPTASLEEKGRDLHDHHDDDDGQEVHGMILGLDTLPIAGEGGFGYMMTHSMSMDSLISTTSDMTAISGTGLTSVSSMADMSDLDPRMVIDAIIDVAPETVATTQNPLQQAASCVFGGSKSCTNCGDRSAMQRGAN